MYPRGTSAVPPAVLFAAVLASLVILPSLILGAKRVPLTCSSVKPAFCEPISCGFPVMRTTCCGCFGKCCPAEDTGAKLDGGDPPDGAPDLGTPKDSDDSVNDSGKDSGNDSDDPITDSVDANDVGKSTARDSEKTIGKQAPERLVLARPFTATHFLPHDYQSGSGSPVATPSPVSPVCVEPGFPGDVHQDGSTWFSRIRPCQVMKCSAGVVEVVYDDCSPSSEAPSTSAPTTSAATAPPATAGYSSGHYYPCEDPNTGLRYQHGATWQDESVFCAMYRCMNGTVQFTGFCIPSLPETPETPGEDLPHPEPTAAGPVVPDAPVAQPPAVEPPPLAPRPSSPDGDPSETGSSCVDDYGQVQASGNVWSVPARPCLRYHCQDGVIQSSSLQCAPTPPGCTALPAPPGRCCPSHACPQGPAGCTYNGRTYSSGAIFADDSLHPCQQHKCDDGLVVALSPKIVCPAVFCAAPDWPADTCCKTCPDEELPDGLEGLKQLILSMGLRLSLPAELTTRLKDSAGRLVAQLAALMRDSDATVTLRTLVSNLIEMADILNNLEGGVVEFTSTDTDVLLDQLRVQLIILLNQLKPTLTDDQVSNANIDIDELIAWLREFQTADRSSAAVILMNDITRLLSGLLMTPGCTDAVGKVHAVDTLYVDNPSAPRVCFVCAKLTSGVAPLAVMNVSDCGGPPPPGCTTRLSPNSCCPQLECTPGEAACRDDLGQLRPHGSTFVDDPEHPCITYNCTNGVTAVVDSISCMPITPPCRPWKMSGFCCPKSDCPQRDCTFNGRQRDHGTTWPQNPLRPCTILTCLDGRVTSEDRTGDCRPPPADYCVPRQVNYQCCPEYDCVSVNCTYNGKVYHEGETWPDDEQYPCKRYNCTRQGTEKIRDLTDFCRDRPHPGCTGQRLEGRCCKEWTCPQCQYGGQAYAEGDIFWDNPARRCAQVLCQAGKPVQLTPQTSCPPIPAGCTPNYSGTSCCHVKYTCPACMFDPRGNFLTMTTGTGTPGLQ